MKKCKVVEDRGKKLTIHVLCTFRHHNIIYGRTDGRTERRRDKGKNMDQIYKQILKEYTLRDEKMVKN